MKQVSEQIVLPHFTCDGRLSASLLRLQYPSIMNLYVLICFYLFLVHFLTN
jgi:hypothetical protein